MNVQSQLYLTKCHNNTYLIRSLLLVAATALPVLWLSCDGGCVRASGRLAVSTLLLTAHTVRTWKFRMVHRSILRVNIRSFLLWLLLGVILLATCRVHHVWLARRRVERHLILSRRGGCVLVDNDRIAHLVDIISALVLVHLGLLMKNGDIFPLSLIHI